MPDAKDEAIALLARALSTALWVVSPNDLDRAIRENVEPRIGKYPDEDWSLVPRLLEEAFNHRYVSAICHLATHPEELLEVEEEDGD